MNEPVPAMAALIENTASRVIGTVLKHDSSVTSYKLALVRAFNDVVILFRDAVADGQHVAGALRILAEYRLAY